MKEGTLPTGINWIIDRSLETIDVNALRFWFHIKNIRILINNRGVYKFPSYQETKTIISDAIKHYYYDGSTQNEYLFEESISSECGCTRGIELKKIHSGFKVDFVVYSTPEDSEEESYDTSFLDDAVRLTRLN